MQTLLIPVQDESLTDQGIQWSTPVRVIQDQDVSGYDITNDVMYVVVIIVYVINIVVVIVVLLFIHTQIVPNHELDAVEATTSILGGLGTRLGLSGLKCTLYVRIQPKLLISVFAILLSYNTRNIVQYMYSPSLYDLFSRYSTKYVFQQWSVRCVD